MDIQVLMRFNTASGRYYCNMVDYYLLQLQSAMFQYRKRQVLLQFKASHCFQVVTNPVSIPQAVGTIAIKLLIFLMMMVDYLVSIPQAVGTIAILILSQQMHSPLVCFNTASGRYYCNSPVKNFIPPLLMEFQYRKRQVLLQYRQNQDLLTFP